jgi:hypothetical protein
VSLLQFDKFQSEELDVFILLGYILHNLWYRHNFPLIKIFYINVITASGPSQDHICT